MPEQYPAGSRWRVIREGAVLTGMQPVGPGAYSGWQRSLAVGDVLTSDGRSWTFGDGVIALKWRGPKGEFLAADCCFRPVAGDPIWGGQLPAEGYLERVEDA